MPVTVDYNDLSLLGVQPQHGPILGGVPLTILGRDFGSVLPLEVNISIGESACDSSAWVSDSSLSCAALPRGRGQMLQAPYTRNPTPETPKPYTLHPTPYTRKPSNIQPSTLVLHPSTLLLQP